MRPASLLIVTSLVISARALKCYSCKSSSVIKTAVSLTTIDRPCSAFNGNSTFEQTCPEDFLGCAKITDPNDSKNVARGCVPKDLFGCKEDEPVCYCSLHLCNGAGRGGWPSAVLLLLAAVLAALVEGR